MLDPSINLGIQYYKVKLDQKLTYASDLYDLIPYVFENSDFLLVYSAKDTGKSTIGYNRIHYNITHGLDVIYGRLQMKEKQSAKGDILVHLRNKYNLDFQQVRSAGTDNVYLNGDTKSRRIKFISMGDYQSVRSSINDNTGLLMFDEINAYQFPPDFLENFINGVSTVTRGSQNAKFYGCGNNETAQNNPMLSIVKLALNWKYEYLQIAFRIVQGLVITVIQIGGCCFNDKRPRTLAQRLGSLSPSYAKKFLLGVNDDPLNDFIVSVPEFIHLKDIVFQFVANNVVYKIYKADINDFINEDYKQDIYYVMQEQQDPHYPLYSLDHLGDESFGSSILLDDNAIYDIFTAIYYKTKDSQLFFESFETRDEILPLIATYRGYSLPTVGDLKNVFR